MNRSVTGGVAVLFVSVLAIAAGKLGGLLDAGAAKQAMGVLFGLTLIVGGNALPKLVRPLHRDLAHHGRMGAVERVAGWVLMLVGLSDLALWVALPPADALVVTAAVGATAFALLAMAWGRLATQGDVPHPASGRGVWLQIFVGLAGAHGLFLVDAAAGYTAAVWSAIGFFVLQGGVVVWQTTAVRPSTR